MASEESIMNCDDLEDGEIEDDEEEIEVLPPKDKLENENTGKKIEKPLSPQRRSNDSKKTSSKKEKSNHDEDDFMCSIESKIANVLKKAGVDNPPMPNIKKHEHSEIEQMKSSSSRNNRKRRKRKERKDQKRDSSSSKKRSKLNDDNLYMVGGSPENSGSESDHSFTSYSSFDSDDYHRSSYEERRSKRRDKYTSRNERDRDRKDRRNRDSGKEICLRFAEYGHCPDMDECPRLHEVRQPRKMELCKFYLLECCAKKEKCSYMHGDFPCKYYYLGLKCINKDCKFMHGKPLTDNLKQILLKHLDTAPKEILGDFPRIGRENATKMISQTHVKLCQEFNVALPETKIPSLLDMKLNPPDEFSKSENRKESSSRLSRWKDGKDAKTSSKNNDTSVKTVERGEEAGDTLLTEMRGILTEKQIETMASIGVKTVNHINNLTVSQINEIGLSLATIGEIQATAMNMHTKLNKECKEQSTSSQLNENKSSKEEVMIDIDMRVFNVIGNNNNVPLPLKSPDTIMSPNQSDIETQENKPSTSNSVVKSSMMSPSSAIDYSQYLRDSNLNNYDENEDEPGGLKIDYASDCENEDKKDSQSEDEKSEMKGNAPANVLLLPPSFDTNAFLNSTSTVLSKVDISSSIQQLMEKASSPTEKTSHRDPRVRGSSSIQNKGTPTNDESVELNSPTYKDIKTKLGSSLEKQEQSNRTSIYEIESPDEELDIKLDKDKDMRVPPFLRDSENGDVDFRFPFSPMTNFIPATEIEASYGTHVFDKYEVKIVDIPKPDYSEIKRSFKKMDNIQDPRLKKICGLLESNLSNASGSSSNLDPRKRKLNESKDDGNQQGNSGPKRLQITTILNNSKHYNELSSSQKMIVNDILSELSKQLKNFHKDNTPGKIFDTTFISQNPRLSQILIGLGVFINTEGEFEEIKDLPIPTPHVVNMPNVHQMPPTIMPNILQQPPPNLMLQPPSFLGTPANLRPGLLGVAPPNLPPFNFDPQEPYGSTTNNQTNSSYGNDQNFNNRNQRGNFNNSHHRNNNYRSNRR